MKNFVLTALFLTFSIAFTFANEDALTENFVTGDPGIQSISTITFGPSGILFIGDSQGAAVIALDTKDKASGEVTDVKMDQIDVQIAAMMGTQASDIQIVDMAINPISKNIYLAVQKTDGSPALLMLKGEKLSPVSINPASYSKMSLKDPVAVDAEDKRGRSLRKWAVSDISYHGNKVLVTGLSNQEFSSTFRSIPFPFEKAQDHASIEIYHAAHGRFETYAPVKTFMPFEFEGNAHIVASYTCTPLVVFPMDQLKDGEHVKGKTVAELGNRNAPLDIISFKKDGKDYFLLANSHRALMKIAVEDVANWKASIETPVEANSVTSGVDFLAMPYVNVQQLDKIDDEHIVIIQRTTAGDLNLATIGPRRL